MEWTPELLLERLGGDQGLAHQLVSLFLTEHAAMLEALRAGIVSGEADAVRRAAHSLKGAVGNGIGEGSCATPFALEQTARDGHLQNASALLQRLEGEMAALVTAMRTYEQVAA